MEYVEFEGKVYIFCVVVDVGFDGDLQFVDGIKQFIFGFFKGGKLLKLIVVGVEKKIVWVEDEEVLLLFGMIEVEV